MNYTDEFERLWKIYPKRAGGNPKPKAFKAFTTRLKEKVLYNELEGGLRRYSAFCRETGILNTPYVLQASTFFGVNNEAWTESWDIPEKEIKETPEEKGKRLNMPARIGETMIDWERRIAQVR